MAQIEGVLATAPESPMVVAEGGLGPGRPGVADLVLRASLERELKFDVDAAFVPPRLAGSLGRWEPLPTQHLRTVYFDTDDRRLWAAGLTLRHRTGEEPGGGAWTLKLPAPGEGPTLDRTELTWPGTDERIPAEASRMVLGAVRSRALCRLVQLDSVRCRAWLRDGDGGRLGELDDDTVVVTGGDRDGSGFRQIEFEVAAERTSVVEQVQTRFEQAGARNSSEQKLAKAISLPTPGWFSVVAPDRAATVGEVVRRACAQALRHLVGADLLIRLDPGDPLVESVHQARVATRRLRSDLKLLSPFLDPGWVAPVRAELRWLGAVLGGVRDADVLVSIFESETDGSSFDADGRDELRCRLVRQRQDRGRALADAMSDARYLELLDVLERAAAQGPPARAGSDPGPVAPLLARLVRKRQHALRRAVGKVGRHPSDLQMHGLRIRAKELRYAAELASPVLGPRARRTAQTIVIVQDTLGEFHDTVTAEGWLRQQARESSVAASYAAGRMAAEQYLARRRLHRRWKSVWDQVDHSWQSVRP